MICVAISGWTVGSSTLAQLDSLFGIEDQIFHDRFEGEPTPPPQLLPVPDQVVAAESLFSYQLETVEPPHERVRFQLDQAPPGMEVGAQDGLMSWVPGIDQQGKHPVVARALDPFSGFDQVAFQITVTGPDNRPPELEPIADRSLRAGQVLSIQPVASDPDLPDDVLSFSLSGDPTGLSLSTATGGITWVPSEDQVGQWPMTLTVTDLGGLSDSTSFTVTVQALGSPPSIEAIPDQTLLAGELLDITAQATDPDLPDDELTFSLTRAPQSMAINAPTGRITWTPGADRVGAHDVTVEVRDQVGLLDETRFVVRVTQPNRAPVALDDEYRVRRGDILSVPAPGVMDNDFDPDGDAITAELLSDPGRGVLDFRADGSFDYTPGPAGPAFEAELVASFREFEVDGNTFGWKVSTGAVVAGDLTGNGRSELLAIGNRSGPGQANWLTAVSFTEDDELELLWTYNGEWSAVDNLDFAMRSTRDPVIGDLNANGIPEVITAGYCRGDILVFSNLGEPLLSTQAGRVPPGGVGTPDCQIITGQGAIGRIALADLTQDGYPEIVFNAGAQLRVFQTSRDDDGQLDGISLLWEAEPPNFSPGTAQYDYAIADVNLDGSPNIWFGGALFDAAGNVLWSKGTSPPGNDWMGWYAVANISDDPFAELIYWGLGADLVVFDHQGNCLWQARKWSNANPPPTLGCPSAVQIPDLPTSSPGFRRGLIVADITGDGQPRIVIGNKTVVNSDPLRNRVIAFNPDGTPLWSVPAQLSSGASVRVNQINAFDLTGNGVMEVVVTGVRGTVVLDGRTGSTLFEIPADDDNPGLGTSSGEEMLYSIIVDLDGDGAAELVVSSNGSHSFTTGLFVYQDPHKRWMPTRQVWNQWAYSVTNINPDLSIPSPAKPNWQEPGLNNYRVNALPVAERVGAVLVDSFREMEIDGTTGSWRVNRGTVVAGDLTGNGRSELLAIAQRGSFIQNTQYLTALSFNNDDEMEVLWYWNGWLGANPVLDPTRDFAMTAARDPVIGDLYGDGVPEVVVTGYCLGDILIFSNTGEPLVSTQAGRVPLTGTTSPECPLLYSGSTSLTGRLSLVDLTGDGLPEILLSFRNTLRAFDGAGTLLWEVEAPDYGPGSAEFDYAVADVNLDGRPNIWFGGTLFDADGNVLWGKATNPLSSDWQGWYAVANLNDDPFGELIFWGIGPDLVVFDHQGQCLWQARRWNTANPPPTLGCPAAIQIPGLPASSAGSQRGLIVADITGDGKPRIVIGNRTNSDDSERNRVIAFNPDGTPFWSVPALLSSGASVRVNQINAFDLTGNGVMEVVVTGVNGTVVLNGRNGQTLFEIPADDDNPGFGTSSGQDLVYSIIVDLDADGAAELVVSSQGTSSSSASGLFVYRHPGNLWMPARQVWNQWAYSVTNINPDLSVPSPAERNWLTRGLNNYRVNALMPGENGALDSFSYRVSDGELDSNPATVYIDIRRPNRPPVFISSPITLAAVGLDYRYRVQAVDPDPGDEVTLSFNQGPPGMSFGADQVLRWQPGLAALGEHSIILSAIDLEGEISIQEFVLTVVEPVAVPDVLGLAQNDAEAALLAAGFATGRISERFDEDFAAGLVAAQQPGAGSLQVPGKQVDLTVSKGPAPIDDSTPPEFPVEAILIDPDELNLLTGETVRLKAFAVFADDSTQLITRAVNWSSDSGAVSVNANGRVSAVSGGSATISAEIDGVVGQAQVQVTARDPSDDEGPVALISAPVSGQPVFEPVEIIGTAFDDNLVRFELALSPAGEGLWTLINQGTSNVEEGVLGTFDPTVLLNGFYDIRLRVIDAGGNEGVDEITVQADGEQKAGLFTLSFSDLTLPLGGLPIEIERIYDSRDRSMGDFGMGWRLGLRSIELKCASRLGEDWFVARSGLSFSLLPMREKACAINLPGGRMEVFDFVVSPASSPFVPFVTVSGQLKPRPGTLGQIEILDNTNFLLLDQQPGEVWLYDDATFNPFNPVELRYTMPDGTVFEFTHGRVSRVIEPNGNSLEFSLAGIEHSSGIGVDFERDTLGRITAITDPSGHTQHYAYSANGDLASHTDALGHTTRFFYNARHGLVRIEDPLGNSAIRSEYDERGRLITLIDAAGNRTEHSYDDEARLKTTTFPDGSVRTVAYDERGNIEVQGQLVTIDGVPVFSEQTWEYDEFGNPSRTVDPDGVVEEADWTGEREWTLRVIDPGGLNLVEAQEFDLNGRVSRMVDAAGRERHYQYDSRGNVSFSAGPGGTDIALEYDSAGRIRGIVNPRSERTRTSRNAAGQVVVRELLDDQGRALSRSEYEYDPNGRLTRAIEVALDGQADSRVSEFSYDAAGRLTARSNPMGEVESFEYDAAGNLTAIVDPLGARTEMDYDQRGLLVEKRLPDGGVVSFGYDHAGRQLMRIDPDGVLHETEYDELGRAVAERINGELVSRTIHTPGGRVAARIDALGHRTDYNYDAAGRLVRLRLPEVDDPASGQRQRPEMQFEYNGSGQQTALMDPLGRRTEYEYDDAGFQRRTIHPDGNFRERIFDVAGRLQSIVDEDGHASDFEFDAAGRLVRVLQPAPAPGEPRPVTEYHYDSFGQLRSRVDALGRVTAFEHDAAGRLLRRIQPDGSSREMVRDAAGRVIVVREADGIELHFAYDALGRLLERWSGDLLEQIVYTPAGRRFSVSDGRGQVQYSYDLRGRLTEILEGDGPAIEYDYDQNGRIISLSVAGESTDYQWDELGRLVRVITPEGEVEYRYDLAGQLIEQRLPNGLIKTVSHDSRGRPLELGWRDQDDAWIDHYQLEWTARGQRSSVTELDGSIETYSYDPIGRLVEAQRSGPAPFDLAFDYDPVGNRLRQLDGGVETLYAYGPNHELLSAGGDSFTYDGRGQRLTGVIDGEGVGFQWDAFGRLVGATTSDGVAQFQVDIDGRRVGSLVQGQHRRLLQDSMNPSGQDQVVAEIAPDGQLLARMHYGTTLALQQRDGQTEQPMFDHRGSVRALSAADGQVTDRYDYRPFGQLHQSVGASANPYRFNGERFEFAARTHDFRARSYDSCSGTFVSPDPFPGFQQRPFSLHPYQFADADPINHIDPLGLFTMVEISITRQIETGLSAVNIGRFGATMCKLGTVVQTVNTARAMLHVGAIGMSLMEGGLPVEMDVDVELGGNSKLGIKLKQDLMALEGEFSISLTDERNRGRSSTSVTVGVGWKPSTVYLIGAGGGSHQLLAIGICNVTVATLNATLGLEVNVGANANGLGGGMTAKGGLSLEPQEKIGGAVGFGGYEIPFFEVSRSSL